MIYPDKINDLQNEWDCCAQANDGYVSYDIIDSTLRKRFARVLGGRTDFIYYWPVTQRIAEADPVKKFIPHLKPLWT